MRIRIKHQGNSVAPADKKQQEPTTSEPMDDGLDIVNSALVQSVASIKQRWKLWSASYWKSKTKRLF